METIKKLLVDGVVTIEEVLEYVEQYQRAMDKYDDEQIDKYYQEQYGDNNIPEYYGDWECAEGTLHSHDQECDCPNYKEECYPQEYIDEMNAQLDEEEQMYFPMHSPNPEYIIASTLRHEEETLIFESDENGVVTSRDDYGGIALRWTPGIDWTDSDLAVRMLFGEGVFEKISDITPHEKGYYIRYKRININ
jgi:hypothetical protein